jgi:hypothetical protein
LYLALCANLAAALPSLTNCGLTRLCLITLRSTLDPILLRTTVRRGAADQDDQSQQLSDDPGRAAVALREGLLVRAVSGSGPARQRLALETKSRVRIAVRLGPSAPTPGLVPRRALVRLRSLGCSVTLQSPQRGDRLWGGVPTQDPDRKDPDHKENDGRRRGRWGA